MIDPGIVHPSIREDGASDPAERTYLETLEALRDSLRSAEEMSEAASVLNPLLDARRNHPHRAERLDGIASALLKAARGARDARSGMACDFCLDLLRLGYDDARDELAAIAASPA